ncbi:IscS subfamily cysteine desulfurase [Flavisolibacter ginsenosidimutans]|uniref:Cysteine desulfurase IscS n=1 Tax=Flavisolibacter ginsenosidimutans TaxID=661481 RepID=A0A5B8UJ45_9BACT|nr:IscS subfamily cysteine desulfurase [Flavisolibacter ginsenosidimutans]QEC56563.1 IscS subfamily cysteine desulfurase [Flavisolibacter ginsenosidimutans]
MLHLPIYLDHNATTPCDPRVVDTMLPYFSQSFGNAASRHHSFGWQAQAAVDQGREQVAQLINAEPTEIIFTSGATEAVNLAIKGVYETYNSKGAHIITCSIEHKAVLDTCKHLEKKGADVTYLPVNEKGLVNVEELEAAIKSTTILIAIMYANNEIGTIQPVAEIGRIAKEKNVLFFSDATQAVGKIPVDVIRDNSDLLALSAHKFYAPKGVGALYVRRKAPRVKLTAQMDGGGHERGLRSGTLNVPGIAGLGKACQLCLDETQKDAAHTSRLRDKLEKALLKIEGTSVNGDAKSRLPQITNLSFAGVDSEGLLMALGKEIALSSGSACTSGSLEPSYVLKALGLSNEAAHGSLRFGLGRSTTEEEIDYTIEKVSAAVQDLRGLNPFWKEVSAKLKR